MFVHLMMPVTLLTAVAPAQVHSGDIALGLQQGRVATGSGYSGSQLVTERVFTTELGITFPNFTDSPGFDCLPGTFPAGSRNGFRILDSLRKWNELDFDTIPPERMEISYITLTRETPAVPGSVEGFTLTVGSNGTWHRHLDYTLLSPASDGVYLLSLEIFSDDSAIMSSAPFWIVFGQNSGSSQLAAATQWVRDHLLVQACSDIDFNNDGLFPDTADIDDFLTVFSGGACSTGTCDPIDFNGDNLFPDTLDIDNFLAVFSGGSC